MRTITNSRLLFPRILGAWLVLSLAASFRNQESVLPGEGRTRAAAPATPAALGDFSLYPAAFDRWFADRAGFRDILVRAHTWIARDLLRENVLGTAVRGKDGWLFYSDPLRAHFAPDLLTGPTLDAWLRTRLARQARLSSRGVPYVFLSVPDKNSVYGDLLPEGFAPPPRVRQETPLLALLRPFPWAIDLTPALRTARESSRLLIYGKCDSHWSAVGAYRAYHEIMRVSGSQGGRKEGIQLSDDDFVAAGGWGGDLLRPVGLPCESDRALVPSLPVSRCREASEGRWRVARCEAGRGTVVLTGDSFALELLQYFEATFGKVVFQISTYVPDSELLGTVERERPELVVEEHGARYLPHVGGTNDLEDGR